MPHDSQDFSVLAQSIEVVAQAPPNEGNFSEAQRERLILAAEKLAIALRKPEENVYFVATQVGITTFKRLE